MPGEHGGFDAQLHALTDDERRAEAIKRRRRQSDRRVAAALSGTFVGTLTEIFETGSVVTVLTRSGSNFRGTIAALGPEIVVLTVGANAQVVLRQEAIEGLREFGSGHDRTVETIAHGPELADILDQWTNENRRLSLTLSRGNTVAGQLSRVGLDQVVLVLDGDGETMTIPLAGIDQIVASL